MATSDPPALNVIALISGGKDSLYSILHCMRNGHRIVALANLRPATKTASASSLVIAGDEERRNETRGKDSREDEDEDDGREEDVDSFMYQTIGHNVIPLYESALGIPLYRGEITGGAVDTARIYGEDSSLTVTERGGGINDDETECLIPLLTRIKREIPHANAVSAGAILSTYQRTRIENVAARLGLVPLAFLWMYPSLPPAFPSPAATEVDGIEIVGEVARRAARRGGLLDDMAAVGCDARIIKVASGGLDADVLWENVASAKTRKRLEKLMRPYVDNDDVRALKGAVLGEGGEYETLALDGPAFLWKKKIVVAEMDREICRDEGGVSHVRVLRARCEEKTVDEDSTSISLKDIPRPDRFDKKFAQLLSNLLDRQVQEIVTDDDAAGCGLSTKIASEPGLRLTTGNVSLNSLENLLAISNVTAPEAGPTAEAQMRGIVAKLSTMLAGSDSHAAAATSDVVFTTVLLRSMQDFAGMNKEYVGLFTKPNPPARVTVACGSGLPEGVQIMVSLIVDRGQRERRDGLHVQSRSYWAPANIGPYSQAITVPCHANRHTPDDDTDNDIPGALVYVAGQIPLDPASMEIADGGVKQSEELWLHNFSLHATLSLQHLWRIGLATKVDWWIGGAVVFLARDNHYRGARKAQIATGIWQAMHSRQSNDAVLSEEEEPALDVWDIKHGLAEDPRLSRDEDESALPNYQAIIDHNHESSQLAPAPPCFVVEVEQLPRNSDIEWQALGYSGGLKSIHGPVRIPCNSDSATKIWCTRLGDSRTSFYTIEIANKEDESPDSNVQHRIDAIFTELGIDVHRHSLALCTIYSSCALSLAHWSGQVVPCYNAWGSDGKDLAAAITIQLGADERSLV